MKRLLEFILISLLITGSGCSPENHDQSKNTPNVTISINDESKLNTARKYDLVENIVFTNTGNKQPEKFNLWVALIRTFPPYQVVNSTTISPPDYTLVTDEHGNQYAEFDLKDIQAGQTISIDINYSVTVYEIQTEIQTCDGELIKEYTQPELHIESKNPQVQALADTLSNNTSTVCQKVGNFYHYIADNLVYTPNDFNWGAQATFGEMGADCTEYASLMIALSRSQNIPARYLEGILYLENQDKNNGRIEHAWLEVYLPSHGWVPIDPTLGRSPLTRNRYFAQVPADRFIVTLGRNPSTLRGGSYFTYIYWPGNITTIELTDQNWQIRLVNP
ncbi:MAG: hypothetical protein E3J69_06315 [Anaerolineales bacterium]|nr:MAG: hypothetical protein E3J69_06315 [Anaerolineales bacterium]